MTQANKIGSEISNFSSDVLQQICISNNWFTRGNNEQYDELFKLSSLGATLRQLASYIFNYSDVETEVEIYVVLADKNPAPSKSPSKPPKADKATKPTKSAKAPTKPTQTPAKGNKSPANIAKSGKVETTLTPAEKVKRQSKLETITADIRKETTSISSAYMRIGFKLWQVREQKLFLAVDVDGKPLKNVYEYCEIAFGFKKSSAINFIALCEKFSTKDAKGQPTDKIDPAFAMFGYTQLSVMLPMDDRQLSLVKPEMSKLDIQSLFSDQPVGQSEDNNDDGQSPKTRTVCFNGEVDEQTWDRLLDKLHGLMGKRIQITVEN